MKQKKLENALSEISDNYIHEAIRFKKKHRVFPWARAVAAVLAVAILAGALWRPDTVKPDGGSAPATYPTLSVPPVSPMTPGPAITSGVHSAYALAAPIYPTLCGYPLNYDSDAYDRWRNDQKAMHDQPEGYADSLQDYFAQSVPLLLTGNGGSNAVCSPLNIYMALAMLAEITDGESRQQILDLLNAESIEALRTQAGQVWKAHYNDDGLTTSVLGASLWLDSDYWVDQQTADLLAEQYYASVFSGDLGSEEMDEALRSWLSQQTGGLLDGYVGSIQMDPRTSLALASTIYYQVQWVSGFSENRNTEGIFHSIGGDTAQTYMNKQLSYGPYYWSDSFGAVSLALEDGSRMWLMLPDEGVAPEQLFGSGEVFSFLAQDPGTYGSGYENQKTLKVNLSLPKFDIAARTDPVEQLRALGVTDIFEMGSADFTIILPQDDGGYVNEITHAARVAVDEDGVTAAAFTLIMRAGAGMPPEEEMDFVLDRPFAFVIESRDGLPLFAGIVNQP